jgi:hypothetical protein
MNRRRFVILLAETVWIYTLAGWAYVAVVAAFTPHLLSHRIVDWLHVRRDTFGIACFACSMFSYLFLQLVKAAPGLHRS